MTTQLKRLHRAALTTFLGAALLGIMPVQAQEAKPAPVPACFNVRDFGAKGDGTTDDTEAIRSAVKAAFERRMIPLHPEYGYFVSFAEVYFPSGYYIIKDTIDINAVNLRGEAYAAIEQKDPAKDIFTNPWAWRVKIEGLTFLGGRVQLDLGNGNIDSGHVTVRDCHFKNSAGVAVQMRKGSNSSFFKVENCVFIDCKQAVINHCDMCAVEDTWISSSAKMENNAVIENYGVMHVNNLCGVPRLAGEREEWTDPWGGTRNATRQRWIDNYGVLHVRNSRFGGEGGGFPAVYNFARYQYKYPVIPNSVTIESSYMYNAQNTSVVLKEIPNMLTVVNCTGMVDAWIARVDRELDLDTYFDMDGHPRRVSINIDNNYGGFGHGLPEQLLPYLKSGIYSEAPPKTGNWMRGQIVLNSKFGENFIYGWVCVESGKPLERRWQPVYFSLTPVQLP